MKKKIKISIQGASGYTGGELIRLLLNHPLCEIVSVSSNFNSGKKISDIHNDLVGDTDLIFSKEIDKNVDVIYLCSCLLYTSPSPRDKRQSRMPSSA